VKGDRLAGRNGEQIISGERSCPAKRNHARCRILPSSTSRH
jgi:hypothetical protein